MNKVLLQDIFAKAKNNKLDVCVEITIPGQKDTEYIINKHSSIDNKLNYYMKTYNDDLEHKKNNDIKIVNAFEIDFYLG